MTVFARHVSHLSSSQIKQWKEEDPDYVNQMPILPSEFNSPLEECQRLDAECRDEEHQVDRDPRDHVKPTEAGQSKVK